MRSQPPAHLPFLAGWQAVQYGPIVAGRRLILDYDVRRLGAADLFGETRRGTPRWHLLIHLRFHPGGREPWDRDESQCGPYRTLAVTVPAAATHLELWFELWFGTPGGYRREWDSNFGRNYWFDVVPEEPPG